MVRYDKSILTQFKDIGIKCEYDRVKRSMIGYYNIPIGFDIETTSTYYDDNKVAFLYEWSMAIKDVAFYGRTIDDFLECLRDLQMYFELSDNLRLPIYVHNLPYEFQFIRKYIDWVNVFAVDERKIVRGLTKHNIEFRDSYILSGYSLAKVADNLQSHSIKKLVGDLDYSLVRHSETELTEKELAYCENDVLIITAYIQEQIDLYGSVTKIPLTNTGRVRQYVRKNCYPVGKKNRNRAKKHVDLMSELALDVNSYLYCHAAFMGGFVHASLNHIGETLKDVHSIDFNSSYPYCMLSEKYPMSRPYYSENGEELLDDGYLSVFRVRFYDLHCRFTFDSYLSSHKCVCENAIVQNGRIYKADIVTTTITNIDFEIINQVYDYDSYEIKDGYYFYKQYLPKPIIESVLKLYNDKTLLKGVKGKEVEYLLSKGMLNSVYGMCVTDIVRDSFLYLKDTWVTEKPTMETLVNGIENYNKSRNRFLYYPWFFITCYARRNLWYGIKRIEKDYVYSDTDSIKFLNYERYKDFIDDYNAMCEIKLKKMCDYRKIDFELCKPKGRLLGVYDYEGKSDYFKTLGAKRYMQYSKKDGLKITVAGLSKKDGRDYILEKNNYNIPKCFEFFNNDMVIPQDKTGKQTHTYIDTTMECDISDYRGKMFHVRQLSGLHLSECGFDMSVESGFIDFVNAWKKGYRLKHIEKRVL